MEPPVTEVNSWASWALGEYLYRPYSPELNPAGRVFEEVRRHIEGEVYPSLEAKRSAIESPAAATEG